MGYPKSISALHVFDSSYFKNLQFGLEFSWQRSVGHIGSRLFRQIFQRSRLVCEKMLFLFSDTQIILMQISKNFFSWSLFLSGFYGISRTFSSMNIFSKYFKATIAFSFFLSKIFLLRYLSSLIKGCLSIAYTSAHWL